MCHPRNGANRRAPDPRPLVGWRRRSDRPGGSHAIRGPTAGSACGRAGRLALDSSRQSRALHHKVVRCGRRGPRRRPGEHGYPACADAKSRKDRHTLRDRVRRRRDIGRRCVQTLVRPIWDRAEPRLRAGHSHATDGAGPARHSLAVGGRTRTSARGRRGVADGHRLLRQLEHLVRLHDVGAPLPAHSCAVHGLASGGAVAAAPSESTEPLCLAPRRRTRGLERGHQCARRARRLQPRMAGSLGKRSHLPRSDLAPLLYGCYDSLAPAATLAPGRPGRP